MTPANLLPALRFEGLVRSFGRLAVLRGVSAEVGSGEALLVTGPNGSGKSTLLKILAGLVAAQGGTVTLELDGAACDVETRRTAVGYVAPDLELYAELTARENLDFFARLQGVEPGRAGALLERVGLPAERLTATLSSGMRQRLRWAWALLVAPPVLLLDEPLQNLDAAGRKAVLGLLGDHLDAGGLAVVANPEPLETARAPRRLELGG